MSGEAMIPEQIQTLAGEIASTVEDLYKSEAPPSLNSRVAEAVDEPITWQARPLVSICPPVYLNGLSIKVRHDKQ